MSSLLTIVVAIAGLGLLLTLFKLLKKGKGLAAKLPTNFLLFFLIYALLGLSGFFLAKDGTTQHPISLGILVLLVSLSGGMLISDRLYNTWEWSSAANFAKKILYLIALYLTSILTFVFIFLLCEHRGFPKALVVHDLVWWFMVLILVLFVPLWVKHLHELWNDIPQLKQVKPIFELPLSSSPPFMEGGGARVHFKFIIPVDYGLLEVVQSKVAVPLNKSIEEAFHFKLHEHNIIRRFAQKIILAENSKRDKMYAWAFYRSKKIWWGWWVKKMYLNPALQVGGNISNGETIFVERVKIWEY